MNNIKYFLVVQLLFSFCLCEISNGQKEKLLNGFKDYYNSLPNQVYQIEEGSLLSTQQVDDTTHQIVASIRVAEINNVKTTKLLKCTATIKDSDNDVTIISNNCEEAVEQKQSTDENQETTLAPQVEVSEPTIERKPVQLVNEVQADTAITSGEQFIAIPRDQPNAPCIGCASHVNPQAAGVSDLANLGVRHLDLHEPSVKHSLETVLDVERQVQVVNGVRYVLTLSINFNHCTEVESENCASSKSCKITILAKPWVKLSNGGNYRAILANNCTEEWQYGDNGEVLPELSADYKQIKGNTSVDPSDTTAFDGDIQVKHNTNVESQPNQERSLTEEDIKKIQEKIIPNTQFQEITESYRQSTLSPDVSDASKQHVFKVESGNHNENSIPVTESDISFSIRHKDYIDYKKFANESLYQFMQSSSSQQHYEVVKVDKAIVQYISRKLIKIDFSISPTDCLIQNDGILSSPQCDIVNPKNILHCNSKILVNNWIDKKQYFVRCNIKYQQKKNTNVLQERNPSDSKYYQLAEESLAKYLRDTGNAHHIIVRVEKVTTQIVSGLLTRIDFIISPKNHSVGNKKTVRCHSEILEKRWTETKAFNVSCQIKKKKHLDKINTDNPKYMQIAVESLQKYIKDKPESNLMRVAFVDKVEQRGDKIKIKFIASHAEEGDGDTFCYAEVSEKRESKSDTEVKCHLIGKIYRKVEITEDDPNYYKYAQLADESIRNYLQKMNSSLYTLLSIESVTVQWEEGIKTLINFTISPIDSEHSELIQGKQCIAEIIEQPGLHKQNIDVKCELEKELYRTKRRASNARIRRHLTLGGVTEHDPSNPEYKALAEESLRKYAIDSGITEPLEVAHVDKVTTQVVSGTLTQIDFLVSGSPNSETIKCHSMVWDRPWLNSKEINISCQNDSHLTGKRQGPGGISEVDPTAPQYKALAEESLQKYMIDFAIAQTLEVVQVERVTTQDVAGILTRIEFLVSGNPDSKTIKCHSEVWEQVWRKFKKIKVSCENDGYTGKRQVSGGLTDQDPTAPQYKVLADESLRKYIINTGIIQHLEVAQVERVTTAVVAGIQTHIDFLVSGSPDSKTIKCHSEVWEQVWRNFKEIKVSCENDGHTGKRQVPGGLTDQDPTAPQYKALAEESLRKYMLDFAIAQPLEVVKVERVTTQVVAGILTRIEFLVSGNPDSKTIKCHSEVWEQVWRKFKKIKVSCENDGYTGKRQVTGGLTHQDPAAPQYKALADESLRKYIINTGIIQHLEVAQVEKVTTQVVAGILTRIDFLVSSGPDSETIKCHSEVWEQDWRNFKEIKVSCENDGYTGKIQVPGGLIDQDPTAPQYKALADESLRKYIINTGIIQHLEVAQVERVTTAVVAGIQTHIDFLVSGSPDSKTIKCHSEVWEQVWRNFKEIKVSCENDGHTGKRQVPGGLTDQDPTAPQYKAIAEESLRKYMLDFAIAQPLEVVKVERVTTQVVAGILTRIEFLVSGNPDSKTIKCHSEVWEQVWRKFKKIKVSCENDGYTGKRQVSGGLTDQDPTAPQYKALADESLRKYIINTGIIQHLEVAQVERVTTAVVAGIQTHIDFLVSGSPDSKTIKCHSEVWEQVWRNFKEIKVSCENDGHTGKRQVPGGLTDQDPTAPQYKALAEESLRKYMLDFAIAQPLEVVKVERVTTQVVAGILTRIEFLVSGNPDSKTIKCHSEVWEQVWRKFKKIKVSCENDGYTGKRQVSGGLTDQDPTAPQYKALADESLRKYIINTGIIQHLEVAQVEKVTTQVVAGILTRIDFLVSSGPDSETIKCHSEVWEQDWRNFKEIKVSCENDGYTGKRQVPGGLIDQDPTAPQYKALAEESLRKYIINTGIIQHLEVAQVERVTTAVVAGIQTHIDFLVSGSPDSKTIKCHSEVWEQVWRNFKEIKVSCENDGHTGKRQVPGGLTDQDPTAPQYKALAEESLRKYMLDFAIAQPLEVVKVERVTTQVVAGILTRIEFLVSGNPDSKTIKCHSEVWEQVWRKFKKIKVSCENDGYTGKRQVSGGLTDQDPTAPQYKALADESLRKYIINTGIIQHLEVAQVEKVTTQVVAGILTRIDFLVSSGPDSETIKCHSEVWEQDWRNFKEIKVSCENDGYTGKIQVPGGLIDQDPTAPQYKALAEESLRKYIINTGIIQHLEVAQVERVTTAVVAGIQTHIDFLVSGSPDSKTIKCHSEVWEQVWRNFKEIKVSCENDGHTGKRQVPGGLTDQDPTAPQYKALAEESLRKYMLDFAIAQPLEVVKVERVTTQVVAGILTRIEFLVSGNPDSKTIKCHSEVWEQVWRKFKKIKVSCENDGYTGKRQVSGGLTDQDPTAPQYQALADESLRKYMLEFAIAQPLEVVKVERVTTQVVAGILTRIEFLVSGNPDSKTIKCHSEVWEQVWRKFKKIKVSCENDGYTGKRQVPGGLIDQDPTAPQYEALAEESLRKYIINTGIIQHLEVAQVERVTTAVVAGIQTHIDFLVSGSPDSKTIKCHSEVWEQVWRNFKEIKVSCENDGHTGKRQVPGGLTDQDPTAPQYKALAEESLRKYMLDFAIAQPLEVVKVERLTTQVVAGILTRIEFLVSGNPDSKTIKCHSEVWEQVWRKFKKIKVSCENDGYTGKRQVSGGLTDQDPTAPQYKALADESLRKYIINTGIIQHLEVAQVEKVTTQVVAGILTRIDFLVSSGPDSETIKCHSEVWEQDWQNFKEIKVSCENDGYTGKIQVPGGLIDQDPTAPQYKALADESLRKYIINTGIIQHLEVAQVERVTTAVVAGILTRIDFLVSSGPDSETIKCHSEVWEQDWRNFKEIKVSCENDGYTGKRQVPGGLIDQDPTAPQYKALAEESLRKYIINTGIIQHLEVAQVERVTTAVIAGILTRIDFLVSGSPDSKTIECHSEVWEQVWRNFKEIKVSCENDGHTGKRQVPGGLTDQDPTAPQYKALAEESLRKYMLDFAIAQPLEVVKVERLTTQVVAGILTRIEFLVSGNPDSKTIKCHSEVWEQVWRKFKKIKVSCENDGYTGKRQVSGGLTDQDPTAPQYKALAEESLRKYIINTGIIQHLEVAQVEKVTTQVVAGILTRIDFLVSSGPDSETIKCHSEVWEQDWRNFKEIKVSCENDGYTGKRQVSGGLIDQDPTAPQYKALAEESLRKYIINTGIIQHLEVAQVERVTTAVVAGILTRIDFLVSGSPDSKTIECHSEVWEQVWRNFKEIKVSCENDGHTGKRQVPGGLTDQDPTAPQYKALAEESLRKYMLDFAIAQPLEVVKVERVTTQVVAGILTRIEFLVSGNPDSKTIKCHSEVWEQVWRKFKKIKVSCENDGYTGKRQVSGGLTDQDPTAPQYKVLADESLRKYIINTGIIQHLEVAQVEKVTTQVVAGILMRIDFLVSSGPDSETIKCHSEVWEQDWRNFKEIKVSCENDGYTGKRQVPGGLIDQDPTAPQYKALAEESLRKYIINTGIIQHLEVAQVERVTTAVVAGIQTHIYFLVSGSPDSKTIKCHSEVWEQVWRNFKEIKVSCENDGHTGKRQVPGGLTDQDPTAPQYKALAEESLRKYMLDFAIAQPLEVVKVERVTTQVVAGILTCIEFLVSGNPDSKTIKCHSEVWEQVWRKFKKIKVSCENDGYTGKRQVSGGLTDQDPAAPQYKALADESLRKYIINTGIIQHLEVAQVEKVTTQVVAGILTRIDFLVSSGPDSETIKCHSEVWEQDWRNFKEIKVSCENDGYTGKRQVPGGLIDQDPTAPQYKVLADESLRKYIINTGIIQHLEVAQVERVTTAVVAGILTHIDFLVSGSPDSKTIECHSEVWEQEWRNFKEIQVSCENDGHTGKRQVPGGLTDQDPTAPQYKALAEESLRKYMLDFAIAQPLEVVKVERVTTQVVAGILTRIEFLVSGNPDSKTIKCHSEVWEQVWRKFKKIKVSCENDGYTGKRQVPGGLIDQDPTAPQYKALAEESFRKYIINTGIIQHLEVAQVERVTTAVVAGILTHIYFLVSGSPDSKTIKCHSEVWEQVWRNFKEIKVSCENDGHTGKRQVPGGLTDQDPTAPQYKALAEESLRKYMLDFAIAQPLEVVKVERVTTQVVAGILTRINFLVSGSPDSKTIKCHSEVWEQGWRNFKEINVSCENDGHTGKKQVSGGLTDQDPTAPQYKALAEESLQKYIINTGIIQHLEVAQVERVTTQAVAGILTRIDFLVSGNPDSKFIKCHSEVWEQGWRNFKEIKVSCENDGHTGKRQVYGRLTDQF